jgi:hypothetical protein
MSETAIPIAFSSGTARAYKTTVTGTSSTLDGNAR